MITAESGAWCDTTAVRLARASADALTARGGSPGFALAAGGGDAPLAPSVVGPLTPAFDDK